MIPDHFMHWRGYRWLACESSSCGLVGKKHLARARLFSLLVLATDSCSFMLCFSEGILALPPSMAGAKTSLLAIQMSGSSAFSSQSHQCCFLVYQRVLSYLFAASLWSICILCSSLCLCWCACLPSFSAFLQSAISSLVHQRLDFKVIFVTGTCS